MCGGACLLAACNGWRGHDGAAEVANSAEVDLLATTATNRLAYIPPQCFTKTRDHADSPVQNPCYVCHAEAPEPNYYSQPESQLSYALPQLEAGKEVVNPWSNLFKDRSAELAAITDAAARTYAAGDNYLDSSGAIMLAGKLAPLRASWDPDRNGKWGGYVPDAYFKFDAAGYDRDPQGRATGWRAFSYYPFPGAFMPTNGSFDDVLIRLPAAFRQTTAGVEDLHIYTVNLAIVEALIKRADIAIARTDETSLGVDLDHDGMLGVATKVAYHYRPIVGDTMHYVGKAGDQQNAGTVHLAAGLFPEGTEFLHSVRYLGVAADGTVGPGRRMKELRYSRKNYWSSYADLDLRAKSDAKEKALNPDQPEMYGGDSEHGLSNSLGWNYQGFIEARDGSLRPQSYEETLYCMGCHTGLAATDDGVFSFARKQVSGAAHGWFHWGKDGLAALPDASRKDDGKREYTTYLQNNGAGDEFRANTEVKRKFFDRDGRVNGAAFAALASDIDTLLLPSAQRALALDKAYWLLVREQSFALGRDAMLVPAVNVWENVVQDTPTGVSSAQKAPRLSLP
jgi:hypothetical protein